MPRTAVGFPGDDRENLRKALIVASALVAVGVIPNKYGKLIAVGLALVNL